MRDIRFRCWDKEKNRWATDEDDGLILFMDGSLGSVDFACWDGGCTTDEKYLSKYILMQSTGLLDKNGKNGYFGDLVKYETTGIFEIRWIESLGEAKLVSMKNQNIMGNISGICRGEIIGDIYTTPELINQS